MAYFTTFGDLQQELSTYYHATGQRLQFNEAVDELYRKGNLSETPPSSEHNQRLFGHMKLGDFSRIVDSIVIPVTPSKRLTQRVNEDDIIPLLRDIFIIRHSRHTRPYLHRHNYVELDYVVEGSCTLHFEEESKKTLKAGELCIVAPYSNHDIEITDESTVYCIMLRRSTFETSFFSLLLRNDVLSLFFRMTLQEESKPNYIIFRTDNLRWMQTLVQNAMLECHKTDEYSNVCCISFINIMLACLLRSSSESPQLYSYYGGREFSSVLNYIRQHYRTLTLTDLAEHFHYSKPHLCTLIKQNTGVSFTDLVRRIRMTRATEYLLNSGRSVSEIAEEVGYHSADHFSRVFRTTYGMSPQEYRKQNEEQADRFVPFATE